MPFTKRVSIEGTIMMACSECARFGTEVAYRAPAAAAPPGDKIAFPVKKQQVRDIYREMGDVDLVADYGRRIRSARTSKNLKQEDIGKIINERKSVIEQLENGRIRPDDRLIAKLEKALGIKLKEKVEEGAVVQKGWSGGLTLGDLMKKEKR